MGWSPTIPFLFSISLADNIAYARPDADRADVLRGGEAAQAHGFISDLPDGYDEVVGERGYTLSGGQRQRVALARTLLANPKILVLDDATSAIDVQVEELIHHALREQMTDRTTIVIAHRLSTIALADRVAALEDGRGGRVGNHRDLLATEPRLRRDPGQPRASRRCRRRAGSTDQNPTSREEGHEFRSTGRLPVQRPVGQPDQRRRRTPVRRACRRSWRNGPRRSWPRSPITRPADRVLAATIRPQDRSRYDFPRPPPSGLFIAAGLVVIETVAFQAGPLLIQIGLDRAIVPRRPSVSSGWRSPIWSPSRSTPSPPGSGSLTPATW